MPDTFSIFLILVALLIGLAIGYLIARIRLYRSDSVVRADAVKRSRSVILGEVYEKVAPFLPDFPYAVRDMVFVGRGIDYIILDGLSAGNLREIIFLEIKSGKSTLNGNERMIRDIVGRRQVSYREYRIP